MQRTPLFALTALAVAAITSNRFVGLFTGAHAAAGVKALGVAQSGAAIGEAVAVTVHGSEIVEAGGAIAVGGPVKSDANGKAIAQAGVGEILGYAVTAATADGQKIEVLLKF